MRGTPKLRRYEGGGIYRPVRLVVADGGAHVGEYGIYVPSELTSLIEIPAGPSSRRRQAQTKSPPTFQQDTQCR